MSYLFAPPDGRLDTVLDTDAYNEIDDQFAIAYMLKSQDRLNTVAIYAAPFTNSRSTGPADGMQKSYDEILKVIGLCGRDDLAPSVFRGSKAYLPDERTPVVSDAARDLSRRAMDYTPERPLWVVTIGAPTNIAAALLLEPRIADRIYVVLLGGHARWARDTAEFNIRQDYAAARVIFSKTRVVQLPCVGVTNEFRISKPELIEWFLGKNPIADYLARSTIEEAEKTAAEGHCWTRVIWDVVGIACLLDGGTKRFMSFDRLPVLLPGYDGFYEREPIGREEICVHHIYRDRIMTDLVDKLTLTEE